MILNFPWSPSSSEMRSKDLKEITGLLPPDTAAQLKYWVCLQVTRYFMPTRSSHWHVYTSQLKMTKSITFGSKKKCKNTHTHLAHWGNYKKNEAFKSTKMGVEGRENKFCTEKEKAIHINMKLDFTQVPRNFCPSCIHPLILKMPRCKALCQISVLEKSAWSNTE